MFSRSARVSFALLASLTVVGPALAAAQSQLPGAACVRDSGGTFDVDSYGHSENTSSSSTLYLVCPTPINDTSTLSTVADVWVTDQHYTSDVCCSQRRMNPIGGLSASSSVCSSGTSSSYQTISTSPPAANGSWDVRYFYCSVPATYSSNVSEIRSFRY